MRPIRRSSLPRTQSAGLRRVSADRCRRFARKSYLRRRIPAYGFREYAGSRCTKPIGHFGRIGLVPHARGPSGPARMDDAGSGKPVGMVRERRGRRFRRTAVPSQPVSQQRSRGQRLHRAASRHHRRGTANCPVQWGFVQQQWLGHRPQDVGKQRQCLSGQGRQRRQRFSAGNAGLGRSGVSALRLHVHQRVGQHHGRRTSPRTRPRS